MSASHALPTTISIIVLNALALVLQEPMASLLIVRLVLPPAKPALSPLPTAPAAYLVSISILTNAIRPVQLSPTLTKETAPPVSVHAQLVSTELFHAVPASQAIFYSTLLVS